MGMLDSLKFKMWDDVDTVVSLLDKWEPKKCKTEKDFENSLYKYLDDVLGDIKITKQFAHGRVKADLLIGNSVIVEMKYKLDTTAKYQRLVGQLTQYSEWKGKIVVILCGDNDSNLVKELKAFIEKQNGVLGDEYALYVK